MTGADFGDCAAAFIGGAVGGAIQGVSWANPLAGALVGGSLGGGVGNVVEQVCSDVFHSRPVDIDPAEVGICALAGASTSTLQYGGTKAFGIGEAALFDRGLLVYATELPWEGNYRQYREDKENNPSYNYQYYNYCY